MGRNRFAQGGSPIITSRSRFVGGRKRDNWRMVQLNDRARSVSEKRAQRGIKDGAGKREGRITRYLRSLSLYRSHRTRQVVDNKNSSHENHRGFSKSVPLDKGKNAFGSGGLFETGTRRDRAIHAPISRHQSHPSARSARSAFRKSREGGQARATGGVKLIRREGRETCNERRKRKRGRAYRRKYKGTGGSMSVIDRDGAEKN